MMIASLRRLSVSARLLFVLLPMVVLFVLGTAWLAVIGSERIADRSATRYGEELAQSQVSVVAVSVRSAKVTVDNLALALRAYAAAGGQDRAFIADLVRDPLDSQADFVTGLWFYAMPDVIGRDADYRGRDPSLGDLKTGRLLTYYARLDGRAGFEPAIEGFEAESWWRRPRDSGGPYATPPYVYRLFGEDRLLATYSVPVIVGGRFIGVVGADFDIVKAATYLDRLRPAGGRLLTVNREGRWIHNPYAPLAGQPARVGADWRTELTREELRDVKAGQSYVTDKIGPGGERVRRIAVPLSFFQGEERRMLLVDFPLEALLAPYKGMRLMILLGSLLAAFAIAVAVFIAVPALIGRPLQTLRRGIENLQSGVLSEPVAAVGRSDDIGAIAHAIEAFRQTLIDRRRLEGEKADLQGKLLQQQKMEAVGQLAGGIAHDFNNLIGVVLGYLAFISADSPPGSSQRKYADLASRAGNRAKDMTRQLLSFARPSLGRRAPLAVDGVMREIRMLLRGMLRANVALDLECEPGLPAILADQTQMIQVLMNLCINAADAAGLAGVRVAIRASRAGSAAWRDATLDWPSFVALTAAAEHYVVIEAFDDAGGIATGNMSRLFEPFFTTKAPGKGTGMGLAIVYGVAQAHGAGLEVRSKRGAGTLFRLSFPASAEQPRETIAAAPRRAVAARRILIVDDEQEMADMLEEGLSRLGHEVAVCEDAEEALAIFDDNPDAFDVVLSDQTMPGLSGVELIRRLKRRRPNLPCLLYTGYSDGGDGAALRASGADAVMFKPVLPSAVDAAIAGLAQR